MTKEQAKQWIFILSAYVEGKEIQFNSTDNSGWIKREYFNFDGDPSNYRVKIEDKPSFKRLHPWQW